MSLNTPLNNAQQFSSVSEECQSCGLYGDVRHTAIGPVLLEENDFAAPLTAADVPAHYRWSTTGREWSPIGSTVAHRLVNDVAPQTVCRVEHVLVCPSRTQTPLLLSAPLLKRLRHNVERLKCARSLQPDSDLDP